MAYWGGGTAGGWSHPNFPSGRGPGSAALKRSADGWDDDHRHPITSGSDPFRQSRPQSRDEHHLASEYRKRKGGGRPPHSTLFEEHQPPDDGGKGNHAGASDVQFEADTWVHGERETPPG